MDKSIFLIGAGSMAVEYVKVLKAQNTSFTVIGRGEKSSSSFYIETGIQPVGGGVEYYLKANNLPVNSYVIVATGTQDLMHTLLTIVRAGASRVLIEKPAAISIDELLKNERILKPFSGKVFVAYNRRFYRSVFEAERLIKEDGGLQSIHFEFTEWVNKITPLNKAPGVKENWFFANSTHIVDLAFYLSGLPVKWNTYCQKGEISWHEKSNFVGAGITERDVLFSYISNWESAGRWAIELLTNKRRIYLKPLEEIKLQNRDSVMISEHQFDNTLDKQYKPGLFKQVEAFLLDDTLRLKPLFHQFHDAKYVYSKILKPSY